MSDRHIEPWPRQRWEQLADDLLLAVRPYASDTGALITLPGPVSLSGRWSDGLEGFARTFLLAAFRVAGAAGDDPHGFLDRYAEGLTHGTDASSPQRWPRMTERRQARVEAASIVIALSETRHWLWDRLDERTRSQVVDWLADIVGTTDYGNNWLWFQNVVEAFLATVGGPWKQADLDRNTELQERLYVSDGWYSDGAGRDGRRQSFDYYAGWAWHVYPLLEARIRGTELAGTYRDRMAAYLTQASSLIAPDGAPVLQGRSLTYRFAMLAPFWAGALAGETPLSPGRTRALTSAVMQYFTSNGAVDDDGLLPIGWHGAFPRLRQLYTGAGSPYWASKAFLGLLLPPDDPVWTAAPEVLPTWERDTVTVLTAPGWLVQSTNDDGIVRVLNHGTDKLVEPLTSAHPDDPFYRRQAYATHAAPQLSAEAIAAPVDSHVAVLDAGGLPAHRGGIERVHLGETVAVSRSRVYWLDHGGTGGDGDSASWAGLRHGPELTTASVVHDRLELRLAWIGATTPAEHQDGSAEHRPAVEESPWPSDPGPWWLRIGGWALAGDPDELAVDPPDPQRPQAGVRRSDAVVSVVRGVAGLDDAGVTHLRGADPLAAASAVPWVRSGDQVGPGDVVAALVMLSSSPPDPPDSPEVTVGTDAHGGVQLSVRWHDGHVDVVPVTADVRVLTAPADGVRR